MRSCCRDRGRQAPGFSLVEVLVALTIVGLALAAAAGMLGTGVRGHDAARDVAAAREFAEDMIAQTGITERLQPGAAHGNFAGRFAWERTVARYSDPGADPLDRADIGPPLYRIVVTVAWEDGYRRRQIALSTLRLAPVPQ